MEEKVVNKKHSIYVSERQEIVIEGVNKLDSFDKNEFLISTTKGYLHIQGKDLTLGNMDNEKGTLCINGSVDSFNYLNTSNNQTKKEGFFKKLFK